jgi:hypothetical protein
MGDPNLQPQKLPLETILEENSVMHQQKLEKKTFTVPKSKKPPK